MKMIFLGLSLFAMFAFNIKSDDNGAVNACSAIDELITEINKIETISNKTTYLKKLESAKTNAEKQNWPMVKESLNSFVTTVDASSATTLKLAQKTLLKEKANVIIGAINKKKAVCKS